MTDVNVFKSILSASFLFAVIRVSTPILLASLGGLVADLTGVTNIALEGIMLSAALMGVVGSAFTQSALPQASLRRAGRRCALNIAGLLPAAPRGRRHTDGTCNKHAGGRGTVFILFSITFATKRSPPDCKAYRYQT